MIAPWVLLAIFCIVASGFYSGCETGVYCLSRIRLRLRADGGERRARLLRNLMSDEQGLIISLLIGTNLFNYLATVSVAHLFTSYRYSGSESEVYTTLIVAPAVFVFGEVLPKNLYQRHADRLTLATAVPLAVSCFVYRLVGLVWVLKRLAGAAVRLAQGSDAAPGRLLGPRQEVIALLREGLGYGVLSEQQSSTIDRVMRLHDLRVRYVMVPLSRVASIPLSMKRQAVLDVIAGHDYSRLCVYRSDPRRIVGILGVHDLLQDESDAATEQLMGDPLRVTADEAVMACLVQMQRSRQPLAVVEADSGRAVGIVTIKDIVEQIVGELAVW